MTETEKLSKRVNDGWDYCVRFFSIVAVGTVIVLVVTKLLGL